ncbi:hypothetical protein J008_01022 [Cryptococcus neoformans]|nr:hypothetical protein C362_00545 [Cryptococcus neoformans var. grubii Bt1]OXG32264.1 hypothetical protein C367_01032 [Cryptococcus neoformans var. grubii Ze90-1]OXH40675.1 hypothetical protein J008_01022 [Cryptococcus neoformans var. grubii]
MRNGRGNMEVAFSDTFKCLLLLLLSALPPLPVLSTLHRSISLSLTLPPPRQLLTLPPHSHPNRPVSQRRAGLSKRSFSPNFLL